MTNSKKIQAFLEDISDDVPDDVIEAAKGIQDILAKRGLKGAFVDANGQFSTTRSVNFVGNIMFLVVFFVLAFTAGNTVDLAMFKEGLKIPEFPAAAAGALALILNGTYAYKHKAQS